MKIMCNILVRSAISLLILPFVMASSVQAKEIKIGVLTSLTGPLALYGHQQVAAIELAVREINERGGIQRSPVQVVIIDTEMEEPGYGPALMDNLKMLAFKGEVVAILVPSVIGRLEELSFVANKIGVPVITASPFYEKQYAKYGKWVIRIDTAPEKIQEAGISKWTTLLRIKRAAIAFDKSDSNLFYESTIVIPEILKRISVELAGEISFLRGDKNFTNQVSHIKETRADGVIINGQPFDIANIVKDMRRHNFYKPVYAAKALFPQLDAKDLNPELFQNLYFGTDFWLTEKSDRLKRLYSNLKNQLGTDYLFSSTVQIYDAVFAIKKILETSPVGTLSEARQAISQKWAELRHFPGLAGTFSVNADGQVERDVFLIRFTNGRYVVAK